MLSNIFFHNHFDNIRNIVLHAEYFHVTFMKNVGQSFKLKYLACFGYPSLLKYVEKCLLGTQLMIKVRFIQKHNNLFITASTYSTVQLTIPLHPGSKTVYTWQFGDNSTIVTTESSVDHVYTESGVYTATVSADNAISGQNADVSTLYVCLCTSVRNG